MKDYYKNLNQEYRKDIFTYYIKNNKHFHDIYKIKISKNKGYFIFIKENINVEFIFIIDYIITKKMKEKSVY